MFLCGIVLLLCRIVLHSMVRGAGLLGKLRVIKVLLRMIKHVRYIACLVEEVSYVYVLQNVMFGEGGRCDAAV